MHPRAQLAERQQGLGPPGQAAIRTMKLPGGTSDSCCAMLLHAAACSEAAVPEAEPLVAMAAARRRRSWRAALCRHTARWGLTSHTAATLKPKLQGLGCAGWM